MKASLKVLNQGTELEILPEEISSFLEKIIPGFVKEAGGILTDNVKLWRWQNQITIIKKAEKTLKDHGFTAQQIPLKTLVPLIENGSLEEEEFIQNKWANMLANAASGKINVTQNYAEILKELSAIEVRLLDQLYSEAIKEPDYEKRKLLQFGREAVCQTFSLTHEQFDLILDNLFRLNLCTSPGSNSISFGGNTRVAMKTAEIFELTSLGFKFVQACTSPVDKAETN